MPRPRIANPGHGFGTSLRRIGGHPAVDFANTIDNDRPVPETIADYRDLISWCEESTLLTSREAGELRESARMHPVIAKRWTAEALDLRALASEIFLAQAKARKPSPDALRRLRDKLANIGDPISLASFGSATVYRGARVPDLGDPVRRIMTQLAALLGSPDFAKIRMCRAPGCGWFFIDRSPSKRRRWCSMMGCGNRAKAQRHYHRSPRVRRMHRTRGG